MDKNKCDPELGLRVNKYLEEIGRQTPLLVNGDGLDDENKIKIITDSMSTILNTMGLDLADDSLGDTPKRVAKMFVRDIFWGLDYKNFPKITLFDNKMGFDEMLVERDIRFYSDCEHHLRPIVGYAHIAYIPRKKIAGLSKLNRVVEYFARRPQVQERLTEQIFHALQYVLETENVAVMIEAEHFCVAQRGVRDTHSSTTTSKTGGVFREQVTALNEFLTIIRHK